MSLLALCSLTLVEAAPRITFDKESLDYGRVLYGDTVSEEFIVTNTGDQTLVIEELRATCGCTKAIKGSKEVAPGGKSKILAEFDTKGLSPGSKKQSLFVHSNDPERPVVKLGISAHVVRQLVVEPPLLARKLPNFEEKVSFPMRISNSSGQAVSVKAARVPGSGVTAQLKPDRIVVGAGGHVTFHIFLTLHREADRHIYTGQLLLETDHPREKEIGMKYFLQVGSPEKARP
jgi:hypothetical protein